MTISLPDLPQLGLVGQMYLMAMAAFFICWLASRASNEGKHGFWTFISILFGCALVATLTIGTIALIAQNFAAR